MQNPGELSDNSSYSDDGVVRQRGTAFRIEKGAPEESPEAFYDVVYLGYWDGANHENSLREHEGFMPCPFVDNLKVYDDWTYFLSPLNVFRISGASGFSALKSIPHVDPKVKYSFSWIGSTVPNARAIFNIQGKEYVCEKITATFTEDGMSQLLKGDFYRVI